MATDAEQPPLERPAVQLGDRPSANDRFIAERVEPHYDELREWPHKYSHIYLLYRAARRKKIRMKKIAESHRILFHSGVAIGGLEDGVTSLVSHQARRVCRSKALTKRYLKASEIPTPAGKVLHQSQYNTAVRYWEKLGRIATVKPSRSEGGRGVTVGVRFEGDLREAWQRAATHLPQQGTDRSSSADQQIIVEAALSGLDLRTFVIGETVASAIVRVPFYVLGDGVSSLGELADAEVSRRPAQSHLAERTPHVTNELLAEVGLSRSFVPSRGTIHHLTPLPDSTGGGALFVDVTDQLPEELKQLAIDGLWAIPGLEAAAVDLLVPDLDSKDGAVVVGISPDASVTDFRYPDYGKYRQPQDALMDQILRHAPIE